MKTIEEVKLITDDEYGKLEKLLSDMGVPDNLVTVIMWVADDGKDNTSAAMYVRKAVQELRDLGFRKQER